MPHAVADVEPAHLQQKAPRRPKTRSLPRELLKTSARILDFQKLYAQSQFSNSLNRHLHAISKSTHPITRILSLGLGSLFVTKGQPRRLKQLAILLGIRDSLEQASQEPVEVYAQDPTFSRLDETLLFSFGIKILRTPSSAELGEAASFISPSTLIYSPFLTLEAYEQLLVRSTLSTQYIVCDDFDALLQKWPRKSAERKQVEGVVKMGLSKYRRRVVGGEGYWMAEDETFPVAVYTMTVVSGLGKVKARI